MAKALSKRIAARMKKNDVGLKKSSRTIFLALRDEIKEALNDGWTVKVVWETLTEEGKVAFSYLGDICVAARVSIPHPARTWKTSA